MQINKTELTIGRGPENDLQVEDPRLSGKHAQISYTLDSHGKMQITLIDLSMNGTFVNGKLVSQVFC